MKKIKRIEKTVGAIIDANLTGVFIFTDLLAMIWTSGMCAIAGNIVEFFIGTPNWPEMLIAWIAVYLLMGFPMVIFLWEVVIEMSDRDGNFLDNLTNALIDVELRDM